MLNGALESIMFDKDPLSAFEAVAAAQHLAFAPLAFQAVLVMRDRGVLAALARRVLTDCTLLMLSSNELPACSECC
jgi:hypothetical protein